MRVKCFISVSDVLFQDEVDVVAEFRVADTDADADVAEGGGIAEEVTDQPEDGQRHEDKASSTEMFDLLTRFAALPFSVES